MNPKKATFFFIILIAIQIFYSSGTQALEFPAPAEKLTINSVELTLNGRGVRTYLFVDVYSAAFYLVHKSTNFKEILDSQTPKVLKMYYQRDLKQDDLKKVWMHSLNEVCRPKCDEFKEAINEFSKFVTDIKAGSESVYFFDRDTVEITENKKTLKISKSGFPRMLLSTWIGENPPTESLKKGLLGLDK